MEWISLNDRRPEDNVRVLFFASGQMVLGKYSPGLKAYIGKVYKNYAHELIDVTHWMPLPEPPNLED